MQISGSMVVETDRNPVIDQRIDQRLEGEI